uniref:Ion transport domain-containing protein n=1 Tax=Phaeomonas parva TaxID=124430 RepID=A0A7S1XUS8_9STRA|mmetsp:Transcript_35000/g.110069  ORF Transcript_35000/g.110069 Transcript_35000/m.110069 type:complete len:1457 (+) Transcript_35000:186-4556(+)
MEEEDANGRATDPLAPEGEGSGPTENEEVFSPPAPGAHFPYEQVLHHPVEGPGRSNPPMSLAMTKKGKALIAGHDGVITFWKIKSGRASAAPWATITRPLNRNFFRDVPDAKYRNVFVDVALSHDNELVIAGTNGGELLLWEFRKVKEQMGVAQLKPCCEIFTDAPGGAVIATSPVSMILASPCGTRGEIGLWTMGANGLLNDQPALLAGHVDDVMCVAFSKSGNYLASGSSGAVIKLWALGSGLNFTCQATLRGHPAPIKALSFHRDEGLLASASDEGTVHVWDIVHASDENGKDPLWVHRDGRISPASVTFAPTGKHLAVAAKKDVGDSFQSVVRIFPVDCEAMAATEPVREIRGVRRNHSAGLYDFFYSPHGWHFITAGADDTIRLWDVGLHGDAKTNQTESWHALRNSRSKRDEDDQAIALSKDGKLLAAANDTEICVYDMASGSKTPVHEFIPAASGDKTRRPSIEFSPDSRYLAVVSGDSKVSICRLRDGKSGERVRLLPKSYASASFSPDGDVIVAGDHADAHFFSVSDLNGEEGDPQPFRTIKDACGGELVLSVQFADDGAVILFGSDQDFHLYDVPRAAEETKSSGDRSAESGPSLRIALDTVSLRRCRLSPDGTWMLGVIEWADGEFQLWDLKNRDAEVQHMLRAPPAFGELQDAAFAPTSQALAGVTDRGSICIWALTERDEIRDPIRVHSFRAQPRLSAVAFSSDGTILATHAKDKKVRLLHMLEPDLSMVAHQPKPDLVAKAWFTADLKDALDSPHGFDWPRCRALVQRYPGVLADTCGELPSLMQLAIRNGRHDFLDALDTWGVDTKMITQAALNHKVEMDEDVWCYNGAFSEAMDAKDGPCLATLFHIVAKALKPESLRRDGESETVQAASHLPDALDHTTLSRALASFPGITTAFLCKVELVPAYNFVQHGLPSFDFEGVGRQRIVAGSYRRSPRNFWWNLVVAKAKSGDASLKNSQDHSTYMAGILGKSGAMVPDAFKNTPDTPYTFGQPAVAYLLPLRNIAAMGSNVLEKAVWACDVLGRFDVMDSPVISTLIEYKWKTTVHGCFVRDLALTVAMVLLFTAEAAGLPQAAEAQNTAGVTFALIAWTISAVIMSYFAYYEILKLYRHGLYNHLRKDLWNSVNLAALPLMLLTKLFLVLDYGRAPNDASVHENFQLSSITAGIALPIVWFSALRYLSGFEESGKNARLVIETTKGIVHFSVVLAVVVAGFALSFYVLFQAGSMEVDLPDVGALTVTDEVFGFGNPISALVSGFAMMLGDFSIEEFAGSASQSLMTFYFVVFQIIVTIILLNLVITIMGDIFDRVQENARAHFLYGKAKICLDYAHTRPPPEEDLESFPPWIQVLLPKPLEGYDTVAENEWAGRLRALKREIRRVEGIVNDRMVEAEERQNAAHVAVLAALERLERASAAHAVSLEHSLSGKDKAPTPTPLLKQASSRGFL